MLDTTPGYNIRTRRVKTSHFHIACSPARAGIVCLYQETFQGRVPKLLMNLVFEPWHMAAS